VSFYVLYQLPLQAYTCGEEYANYMQICQLYGICMWRCATPLWRHTCKSHTSVLKCTHLW